MKITYTRAPFGHFCINPVSDPTTKVLVQSDCDFPGLAASFGWRPTGKSGEVLSDTDGTVTSAEDNHETSVAEFISSATDFLDEHEGAEIDDPGYFDN